eukprot:GHVN01056838.1.p1 GENE.GHVN01056838.1~~GHVN01056838.1.p1  ORF type:complete len:118 (-),score=9.83 GHVN01056838.1:198-551(-)
MFADKNEDGKTPSFMDYKEQVHSEVKNTLEHVLGSANYDAAEVPQWVETITNGVLERLQNMCDGYKYIVSVVVLQRSRGGFHLFSTCYWDQQTDGTITVRYDSKALHCIVTVYGLAF